MNLADMGSADPRAMGTELSGDPTMKVKTHVRAGALAIVPPPGGGRCGA